MVFENKYSVTKIENSHIVECKCPIGRDVYTANIFITIESPKYITDYMESDKFIDGLRGNEFIVEDLALHIANYFKEETKADAVKVKAIAVAPTHSSVVITVTL